jgi:hypothetical protein
LGGGTQSRPPATEREIKEQAYKPVRARLLRVQGTTPFSLPIAAREARFRLGFTHRQLRCGVDRNDGQSRPLLQVRARTLNGTLRETFSTLAAGNDAGLISRFVVVSH